MKVIALLLISIFPSMGFAEGPPVDEDGKVFVDHVVLHLTDDQMGLIETKRLVEFTPSQLATLKVLSPQIPQVIPVVTPSYNNCTCELLLYGIWNGRRQIAIPLLLFGHEGWAKYALAFDKQITSWGSDFFVIDTQANIYLHGKRIAKEDVIQIAKQTESGVAFIDRPLVQSPQVNSKVEHLLKFLVREGKKSKVQVSY